MKSVLFLADCGSAHTRKWVLALAERDITVGVFSIGKGTGEAWWEQHKNVVVFNEHALHNTLFSGSIFSKIAYLRLLPALRKAIKNFSPDIIHAHYATSYGLLGRLCGFHPFILSAWGSDVMDFPQRGFLYRTLLKGNLESADVLLATSPTIVAYIHKIVQKKVRITPFGIDTNVFKPITVTRIFKEDALVIGTVKSLEQVYRIDLIIEAFAKARTDFPLLKLLIVGGGTLEQELKQLAAELHVAEHVHFTGRVRMNEVPQYHNMIDVFVNVPDYESFGVSVLEASACARPVIVTNVGGLKDVVKNKETGLLVPKGSVQELTDAVITLVQNVGKRAAMGVAGRKFVQENYELSTCVNAMLEIYDHVLKQKGKLFHE